jgi:hypothetical protein
MQCHTSLPIIAGSDKWLYGPVNCTLGKENLCKASCPEDGVSTKVHKSPSLTTTTTKPKPKTSKTNQPNKQKK